jgi:succinoglycan biosynthesis transport protein ExoP
LQDATHTSRFEELTSGTQDAINVGALFRTLWHGKFVLIFATVVTLTLGGVYAYIVATPLYSATAVIMLNSRQEQVVDLSSVVSSIGSDTTSINTEVEVLQSRLLLGKVVDELDLMADPEFNSALREPSRIAKIKLFARRVLMLSGGMPEAPDLERQHANTINALLQKLTIRNIPQTLVFEIMATTTNPRKSAKIADTMVDLYIVSQLETKFEATQQATEWMTDRVTTLQTALETAEERVATFRANTSLINQETLSGLEVQIKETRDRIASMQESLSSTRVRLERLRGVEGASVEDRAQVADDQQLNQLLSRIDQPNITDAFDRRFNQVLIQTEADLTRLERQRASLQSSLAVLEDQAKDQGADLITLQQLNREAEASRILYEYFLTRLKETSAQEGVQQADSRIISPAVVPGGASSPRKALILAASMLFGLIAGTAFLLIREMRNNSFRSVTEMERETGYPVIGQVPIIPSSRRQDTMTYLKSKPTSAAAEAIRNLRTSIMLSKIDTPPKIIMVCSSLPGEGKTTTSLALAMNFASMGRKTLLIEGDIRRQAISKYITGVSDKGIMPILTGETDLASVITHSDLIGADVLAGGRKVTNAADVFSSERFARLLLDLREQYDFIIIDTPPVLIVPDARIICQHVDATVFAVKWNSTESEQVHAALKEFESAGRPVNGLVLNQINPRSANRYGYSYGYSYGSYNSGYYTN